MSETLDLDFLEYLADLGMAPGCERSHEAARNLEKARLSLRQTLAKTTQVTKPEEAMLGAVDIALAGLLLNDRKMRLLAALTREALDRLEAR